MRARYMPWRHPKSGEWVILDFRQMEFCRLPVKQRGKTRSRLLTWKSRAAADAWLQNCYLTWKRWEKDGPEGDGQVPADWRPRPERVSPYANGLPFPRD